MAEIKFMNETSATPFDRAKMMAFINVAASSETEDWAPLGIRATSADHSYDWQSESSTDIFGNIYNSAKKPIVSTSLDPWPLTGNDKAQKHIWKLAVAEQDHVKLSGQDILIVHSYATVGSTATNFFAERYNASMVAVTRIGGDGGGLLTDGCDVTFGGERTVGKATLSDGTVTYTEGLED